MNIKLVRKRKSKECVEGYLSIDSRIFCDTAENTNTLMPTGKYGVSLYLCKQYHALIPLITSQNLEKCKISNYCKRCRKCKQVNKNTNLKLVCQRFSSGNGIYNRTDGAIIIGKRITRGCVKLTVAPYNELIELIMRSTEKSEEIMLTIVDEY